VLLSYSALKYRFIKPGAMQTETVFEVKRGAGLSTIAAGLSAEGLIGNPAIFKLFVKLDKGETSLKAGEFIIPPAASPRDIYEILRDGKAVLYPITIAEGLTSAQIIRQIEAAGYDGEIPKTPAEGTLLPETYLLPKYATTSELLAKMASAQTELLDSLWDKRAPNLPIKSKYEAVILASIVEKETGQTAERERVAGVFINRLNKGMRLESDPTIIYGITGGEKLGRGLRRSEIDTPTDWNTYQIARLPITPICNPGAASIAAVLNPMQTDDLFFVADGSGGHAFASTLSGHNDNVANWRKIEREKKAAQE
jgi:UPF0755 protein